MSHPCFMLLFVKISVINLCQKCINLTFQRFNMHILKGLYSNQCVIDIKQVFFLVCLHLIYMFSSTLLWKMWKSKCTCVEHARKQWLKF